MWSAAEILANTQAAEEKGWGLPRQHPHDHTFKSEGNQLGMPNLFPLAAGASKRAVEWTFGKNPPEKS